ncbi:hypothetical protein [Rhodoplanes sp. SY1]|uniref:hypothetical protein n=1 Tax=Rhodoplanes sp. SY1 TaxID=3166646 RepID=UPI0038B57D83
MDRKLLLSHLGLVEAHIAAAARKVARQKALIEELERDGANAASAKALLSEFQEFLRFHLEDRVRILEKLSNIDRSLAG